MGFFQEEHFSSEYKDIRLFVFSTRSGGGQKGRLGWCGQAAGGCRTLVVSNCWVGLAVKVPGGAQKWQTRLRLSSHMWLSCKLYVSDAWWFPPCCFSCPPALAHPPAPPGQDRVLLVVLDQVLPSWIWTSLTRFWTWPRTWSRTFFG